MCVRVHVTVCARVCVLEAWSPACGKQPQVPRVSDVAVLRPLRREGGKEREGAGGQLKAPALLQEPGFESSLVS